MTTMIDEDLFEEVSKDIINAIVGIQYADKEKDITKLIIARNIYKFLESYEIYEENIEILNEESKNGKRRILNDRL